MAEVQVENIVVSFSVAADLDLPTLATVLPDAHYEPDEVPAIVLQFSHPHSMAALCSTGQVMLTGPKTFEEVDEVMKMILDRLNVVGVETVDEPEICVQNVTASADLHQELPLKECARFLQIEKYSLREFPGLVYQMEDPNTVILLFDSGKIVCNGPRLEDVTCALEKMIEKLVSFGIKKEENVCPK
jgi:transcription initiation factor TFIID TATA-box-binding protein